MPSATRLPTLVSVDACPPGPRLLKRPSARLRAGLAMAAGLAVSTPAAAADCWATSQLGDLSTEEAPNLWDADWIDTSSVDPHEDDGGFTLRSDKVSGGTWFELDKDGSFIQVLIADNGAVLVPPAQPLHLWLDARGVSPAHRTDFYNTVPQCWPTSIPGPAVQKVRTLISQ